MNLLKRAMGGDGEAQQAIFEEPLRGQIATVLDENNTWQMAMLEKLKRHDDFTENNRSKRSRREP